MWTFMEVLSTRIQSTVHRVHTLTQTQLKALDTLTDKAVKKWIEIPRSATNVVIHMQQSLDIRSISHLCTETHTISHVRTRLKGDLTVNNAINSTLDREGMWTTKQSTAVQSEEVFVAAKNIHTALGEIPEFTGEDSVKLQCQFNNKVSTSAKKQLQEEHMKRCSEKI